MYHYYAPVCCGLGLNNHISLCVLSTSVTTITRTTTPLGVTSSLCPCYSQSTHDAHADDKHGHGHGSDSAVSSHHHHHGHQGHHQGHHERSHHGAGAATNKHNSLGDNLPGRCRVLCVTRCGFPSGPPPILPFGHFLRFFSQLFMSPTVLQLS